MTASPPAPAPLQTRISPTGLAAAFFRRDWIVAVSYRAPFIFALFQTFASLVLVYFLSKLVGKSQSAALKTSYFSFVAIGLVVLEVLTAAIISFAQKLRTDQTTGTFETVIASPIPSWLAVLASASYELVYAVASAGVLLVFAVVFFGLRFHTSVEAVAASLLTMLVALASFSALGMAYAASVVIFKRSTSALTLVGTGLGLLGGVYYPISLLPRPVAIIAEVLPITQAATIIRDLLLSDQVPWGQIGLLALFAAVALPISFWLVERAILRARRTGTLGQY